MTANKLMLMLTVLLGAVALSAWVAMTGNAADGPAQPNQPAIPGNPKGDEEGKDDGKHDAPITVADAEKAKEAALRIAGGGTVQNVEKGDDGNPGWYEVEIRKADGAEVKVQLDNSFNERKGGDEVESKDDDQEGSDD